MLSTVPTPSSFHSKPRDPGPAKKYLNIFNNNLVWYIDEKPLVFVGPLNSFHENPLMIHFGVFPTPYFYPCFEPYPIDFNAFDRTILITLPLQFTPFILCNGFGMFHSLKQKCCQTKVFPIFWIQL